MEESTSQMHQSESELVTSKPELIKCVAESAVKKMGEASTTNKASTVKTPIEDIPEKLERTLFVCNIPLTMTINTVKEIFKPCGEIENTRFLAVVPKKMSTGANARYEYNIRATSIKGFIMFETTEAANEALKLNNIEVKGHHLQISKATSDNWGQFTKESPHKLHMEKAVAKYLNVDKTKSRTNISYSVFIGNLPFSCEDETLWTTFAKYGRVKNVKVIRNKKNDCIGFGFVEYENKGSVKKALAQKDIKIQDNALTVQQCRRQKKNNGPKTKKKGTATGQRERNRKKKLLAKKKRQSEKKPRLL